MIDVVRTILLVEDNELNREMLNAILTPTYNVIEAENGKIGIELLQENRDKISLVLLDLQMPVMNGYEFMEEVKKYGLEDIPIIVTTSSESVNDEISCLDKGATDFVTKPYNADIILKRINSIIRLSEVSSIVSKAEYDDLTGVYNKEFFYLYAERHLIEEREAEFDMVCLNINFFKFVNMRYGKKETDKLLVKIATEIKSIPDTICGRLNDEMFGMLIRHRSPEYYGQIVEALNEKIKSSSVPSTVIHLGIYKNVDHGLPTSVICDNAMLAIYDIKHLYDKHIAEYDEELKNKLIRKDIIFCSMEKALEQKQFEVYYQPKYNLQEDKVGGAEALIRWHHPELGFLSPGEFIPIFEANRFISKLDFYIAEQVCSDLHVWLEKGNKGVPVSINMSRVDFENEEFIDDMSEMVDGYGIPHELIHFEVTESAYAENPHLIKKGIEKLRRMGFKIEIDDFGSGYSSLRVLDDVEFDVLKLDMSLVQNSFSDKRKFVLQYIFSLTDRLDVDVVAEGIETKEQAEAFKNMGCEYAQGYYYSKPIPKEEFENFLSKAIRK